LQLPLVLQPPCPLQLFVPFWPPQPPWPLQLFLPAQSCLPVVSLLGAFVPTGALVLSCALAMTPVINPVMAAVIRSVLCVLLMMFFFGLVYEKPAVN
jgi:hypothetical protein